MEFLKRLSFALLLSLAAIPAAHAQRYHNAADVSALSAIADAADGSVVHVGGQVWKYDADGTQTIDGIGVVDATGLGAGRWLLVTAGTVYDTIAAVQAAENLIDGEMYYASRYGSSHAANDGSGGPLIYDAGSVETPDNGHVFAASGMAAGNLIRLDRSVFRPEQFGAVGNGSTICTTQVQACIDAARNTSTRARTIEFGQGIFLVDATLDFDRLSGFTLRGAGAFASIGGLVAYQGQTAIVWQGGVSSTDAVLKFAGEDIVIENLSIWGHKTGQSTATHYPLSAIGWDETAGLGEGKIRFVNVYVNSVKYGFDVGEAAFNQNRDVCNWVRCRIANCERAWNFRTSQNVGYSIRDCTSYFCDDVVYVEGGGMVFVDHLLVIDANRMLVIAGSGSATGPNNAFFDFRNVKFDVQAAYPQLVVTTTDSTGTKSDVLITNVRVVTGTPAPTVPVFDLRGKQAVTVQAWESGTANVSSNLASIRYAGNATIQIDASLTIRDSYLTGYTGTLPAGVSLVNLGAAGGSGWYRFDNCRDQDGELFADVTNAPSPAATATALGDISDTINTGGKFRGKQVWDTTNGRPVWANGSAAADVWKGGDGTTLFSPS